MGDVSNHISLVSTGGERVGDLFTAEFVFVMRETVISYFLCAFGYGTVASQ